MRISFFPTPEHRVFNYKPRYYDPEKEKLRKIYEKYGKVYPGDEKASAVKAAEDLKDVASYSEVKSILGEDGNAQATAHKYVPGQYIRGAYKEGLEASRRQAGNQKVKRIIIFITLAAAFVVAWYLAQGLAELFR